MKYLQNGGFQSHPLMRLTLALTLLLLVGFVATNFLLFFAKMDLTPASVVSYYQGSEEEYRPPRSYQSMVEVSHGHLAMMALVLLLLTHLLIFPPLPKGAKVLIILTTFAAALAGEAAGWLVRFVHADFAWLKVVAFVTLQVSLLGILGSIAWFLIRARSLDQDRPPSHQNSTAGP
jgi:hypothetical protein